MLWRRLFRAFGSFRISKLYLRTRGREERAVVTVTCHFLSGEMFAPGEWMNVSNQRIRQTFTFCGKEMGRYKTLYRFWRDVSPPGFKIGRNLSGTGSLNAQTFQIKTCAHLFSKHFSLLFWTVEERDFRFSHLFTCVFMAKPCNPNGHLIFVQSAPHGHDFLISSAEGQFYWTNFHNRSGSVLHSPLWSQSPWQIPGVRRAIGGGGGTDTIPRLCFCMSRSHWILTENIQKYSKKDNYSVFTVSAPAQHDAFVSPKHLFSSRVGQIFFISITWTQFLFNILYV